MLKKLNDFLAGLPMTIVAGVFLLLDLAIWRVIYNPGISKISSALLICIAMFAAIGIGDLFAACEAAFIMAIGIAGHCSRRPHP